MEPRPRQIWLTALLVMNLMAAPLHAAPPTAEETAELLHEQAKASYKVGQRKQAIEFWREAYGLTPFWKYAYNAANALYEDAQFEEAWTFLGHTERANIPGEFAKQLSVLRAKTTAELKADHAFIELTVSPEDASVRLDGQSWDVPRALWVRKATSQLAVTHPGYLQFTLDWSHAIGGQHKKNVQLEPIPAEGYIHVSGSPEGAIVAIDGKLVGKLPFRAPLSLSPGEHEISVRSGGYVAESRMVPVAKDRSVDVQFDLIPMKPVDAHPLRIPGWATLGAGLGAVAIGGALLGWADAIAIDQAALNQNPSGLAAKGSYESYVTYSEAEVSRYDAIRISGWTIGALGAAAAVGGAVLLTLDAIRGEPASDGSVIGFVPAFLPLEHGVLLQGGLAF